MRIGLATLPSLAALAGCALSPSFSVGDGNYFMEKPLVIDTPGGYELCWQYGEMGFFFEPSHAVRNGQLQFALSATSSSGALKGKYGSMAITGSEEIEALKGSGAFWLEPDGSLVPLEIRTASECGPTMGSSRHSSLRSARG